MTTLAVAPPWTTASSINLRRATPILPIAIGRPNSPPHQPLAKQPVTPPRRHTARDKIPIAPDAPHCPTSRGFLPWRFAYAGPRCAPRHLHGAGIRKPSHKQTLAAENLGEFLEIGNGIGDSTTQEPQNFHGRASQAALTSRWVRATTASHCSRCARRFG
jgi:hypothetical protein